MGDKSPKAIKKKDSQRKEKKRKKPQQPTQLAIEKKR